MINSQNDKYETLKNSLKSRMATLKTIAEEGVIPGVCDTYELQQLIGRIKELKFVLKLLSSEDIMELLDN